MYFTNGMPDFNRVNQAMERGRQEMAAARAAIQTNEDDRAVNGLTPTKAQRVSTGLQQVATHAPLTPPEKGWGAK
jgi:hypothetical protein